MKNKVHVIVGLAALHLYIPLHLNVNNHVEFVNHDQETDANANC